MILDADVLGERDIQYDVARDRIVAEGKFHIAIEFREILLRALSQEDMLQRLEPDTHTLVKKLVEIPAADYVRAKGYMELDERELSAIIEELVPRRVWRPELSLRIASRLKVPQELVERISKQLLDQGLLTQYEAGSISQP